jgi:hypothetical protein
MLEAWLENTKKGRRADGSCASVRDVEQPAVIKLMPTIKQATQRMRPS